MSSRAITEGLLDTRAIRRYSRWQTPRSSQVFAMPSSKSEDLKKQLDLLLARVKEQSTAAHDLAKQLEELRRQIADAERHEKKR